MWERLDGLCGAWEYPPVPGLGAYWQLGQGDTADAIIVWIAEDE